MFADGSTIVFRGLLGGIGFHQQRKGGGENEEEREGIELDREREDETCRLDGFPGWSRIPKLAGCRVGRA